MATAALDPTDYPLGLDATQVEIPGKDRYTSWIHQPSPYQAYWILGEGRRTLTTGSRACVTTAARSIRACNTLIRPVSAISVLCL